jgi:hypothetical protein
MPAISMAAQSAMSASQLQAAAHLPYFLPGMLCEKKAIKTAKPLMGRGLY